MKQIQIRPQRSNVTAPVIQNSLIPQYTTVVRETTTTTVTRERTTYTLAPICGACGETKTRIIGMLFECLNEACSSHDPDPAAAIPLRGEQKEVIDIEPGEARRAA